LAYVPRGVPAMEMELAGRDYNRLGSLRELLTEAV